MKYILLFVHLLFGMTVVQGQVKNPSDKVVITGDMSCTQAVN
jgi:hypothetical protein